MGKQSIQISKGGAMQLLFFGDDAFMCIGLLHPTEC